MLVFGFGNCKNRQQRSDHRCLVDGDQTRSSFAGQYGREGRFCPRKYTLPCMTVRLLPSPPTHQIPPHGAHPGFMLALTSHCSRTSAVLLPLSRPRGARSRCRSAPGRCDPRAGTSALGSPPVVDADSIDKNSSGCMERMGKILYVLLRCRMHAHHGGRGMEGSHKKEPPGKWEPDGKRIAAQSVEVRG